MYRSRETKRRRATGEAAFESYHQDTPNPCLTFYDSGQVSGQGQVKFHNEAFSHFGLSGRLGGLQKAHTHPKCWIIVHKESSMSMKDILKKVKVNIR